MAICASVAAHCAEGPAVGPPTRGPAGMCSVGARRAFRAAEMKRLGRLGPSGRDYGFGRDTRIGDGRDGRLSSSRGKRGAEAPCRQMIYVQAKGSRACSEEDFEARVGPGVERGPRMLLTFSRLPPWPFELRLHVLELNLRRRRVLDLVARRIGKLEPGRAKIFLNCRHLLPSHRILGLWREVESAFRWH